MAAKAANIAPNVGKCVTLLNGNKMPLFGLGTFLSPPGEVEKAVDAAVRCGYRHIDTAWSYKNEKEIGNALQKLFKEGVVKREDLFITTKVHGYFYTRSQVFDSCKESLEALQLDYVDMLLVHTPIALQRVEGWRDMLFPIVDGKMALQNSDHLETWEGMEDCYNNGKAKAIGLSNFSSTQIQRIWDNAKVKPMNLQVECHAYWPQGKLHSFCREKGITFTAYGPIGSPGSQAARSSLGGDDGKAAPPSLMEHGIVKSLAAKYSKTPAQILLRYLLQREIIVIPKSTNPARIKQNMEVFDFTLSDGDFDELSILPHLRLFNQGRFPEVSSHPNYKMDEDQ